MALYSAPPPARPFSDDKPVLLVSWWITVFCALVIVLRLIGRYVRVEKLFAEDKVAALVLIPLFLRMAFVHPVLLFGTNNVLLERRDGPPAFTEEELRRRGIGSGLVLASRVAHASILWLLKLVTLRFFDRLVGHSGRNRFTLLLRIMHGALLLTFLAVVVATVAECRPLPHYWRVLPDPGGPCRQASAQLLAATACSVATDLLLVAFPVPIVARSRLRPGRKLLLVALFCPHLLTVAVAVYRVPLVLAERGYQATRTLWAGVEVLAATFAANALTIGTFVRDTGVKKQRARYQYPPSAGERAAAGAGGAGEGTLMSSKGSARAVARGRSVRGGGGGGFGTGKAVAWEDVDDDEFEDEGGDEEAGRKTQRSSEATGKGQHSRNGSAVAEEGMTAARDSQRTPLARTGSKDSLIPRSRVATATPDSSNGVIKTTTIEVTVADGEELRKGRVDSDLDTNGLVLTPLTGVVTASVTGRGRGSSIFAKELQPLPGADFEK